MNHLLHHFRRSRTYSSRERWAVFATLFGLTLVVSAGSGLLFGKPAISDSSTIVQNIQVPKDAVRATGKIAGEAVVTIIDKNTLKPVSGVWIGARIEERGLRTASLTYFDWYSPIPDRAFFPTDALGQIKIPLASNVAGAIEYQVYMANPEASGNSKYQPLHSSFVVTYK